MTQIEAEAPLLEISGLSVGFGPDGQEILAVENASLTLARGKTLGLVGESGSGKSVTALSIVRLMAPGAKILAGTIHFQGQELTKASESVLRNLRGARISMVFQEPMTSLNPLHKIERQIGEILAIHGMSSGERRRARVLALLREVGLQNAESRMDAYPHELSGGQRQRAMIAMALSCAPRLVIADEPTTALDVTVQAQILDLIADLREQSDMALILVSHDLAVIAQNCERVLVMYGGMAMESGRTEDVLARPAHPYTKALLQARPRIGAPRGEPLKAIAGAAPSADELPRGCPFAGRCPLTIAACSDALPAEAILAPGHVARCIRLEEAERLP